MPKTLAFIRHNAIALAALFVALGGTSYAAFNLPAGSVGTRQLRVGAVTASKLNATTLAAGVRAWATLRWTGVKWSVQASSRDIQVSAVGRGDYVSWRHTRFPRNCMASVTPIVTFGALPPIPDAFVSTAFDPRQGVLAIDAVSSTGTFQPQSVSVLIFCPSPGSEAVSR